MKSHIAKSIAILTILCGAIFGPILYNLVFFGVLMTIHFVGFDWIFTFLLFLLGILIAVYVIKPMSQEFAAISTLSEINPIKLLKFFVGGLVGSFATVSVVGPVVLVIYLVVSHFLF